MKHLILYISLFLISSFCLNAQTNTTKVKEAFPKVYHNIYNKAEKEWVNDYKMQAYVIDKQCDAFIEFLTYDSEKTNVPPNVLSKIHVSALKDWSANSFEECLNEKDMFACADADWTMVIYVVKEQVEAYKKLH
jgi:hypothetical protein